jgi:hypothetical protein
MGRGGHLPNAMPRKRRATEILPWVWGAVALCGVAPNAVAGDLLPAHPSVWAAAGALSLTLIAAVRGSQK